MTDGSRPAGIAGPAVFVAIVIGVTVWPNVLTT